MIIVDRTRLGPIDPHAGSFDELWTNGPAAPAEAEVLAQDRLIFDTIDQAQVFDAADYLGITWTFGYLTALAGLVGLVSVGALLLYVETRQRTRVAAYALGRRMGLSRATHLRSLLAELGLLLGLAYVVGVALSWLALGLVHGLLDVDPARPADVSAGAAGRRPGRCRGRGRRGRRADRAVRPAGRRPHPAGRDAAPRHVNAPRPAPFVGAGPGGSLSARRRPSPWPRARSPWRRYRR